MKKVMIIVAAVMLAGCGTKQDYSLIPEFRNNFKEGKYQISEEMPHIETLAAGCKVGSTIEGSNFMLCEELNEKYINQIEILDLTWFKEQLKEDMSVLYFSDADHDGYMDNEKKEYQEGVKIIESINVIQSYPNVFNVAADESKSRIPFTVTFENDQCKVEYSFRFFDESGNAHMLVRYTPFKDGSADHDNEKVYRAYVKLD